MSTAVRVDALGDGAVTLTFGSAIDAETGARVLAAADAIRAASHPAVRDVVAAYTTVTVFYDPLHHGYGEIVADLIGVVSTARAGGVREAGRLVEIAVRYDGPDLAEVARETGLTPDEVVRLHSGTEYRVHLLGFAPGFAYLGELPTALHLPRRASPRTRVPAGSVAIAGAQTAVYPLATPGGWHLLGTTRTAMWDVRRDPPALLRAGDRVRFTTVDE
ncbi:MAG TPA: 5-oxoprolinase subunit PxpB [Longimicrobiaceae bacterium]|nr:5-oxoprolinase subunit PxpB [Longimicrobiaceae bacterium]